MKHFILFGLLLFLTKMEVVAARNHSDSLWNIWEEPNYHDTVRLNALDEWIHFDEFSQNHPDSAAIYAELLLEFAEVGGYDKFVAKAYTLKGMITHQKGAAVDARKFFFKALEIQTNIHDRAGAANSLNRIGVTYRKTGEYHESLEYYQRSLSIQQELRDSVGTARALQNIGVVHMLLGDYSQASQYMTSSIEMLKELNQQAMIAAVLNNLGMMYMEIGEMDSAVFYYNQGIDLRIEIDDEKGMAGPLFNIGIVRYYQSNFDEAISYLDKSLKIFNKYGDSGAAAQVYSLMGQVSRDQGDFASAIDYNHQSLQMRRKVNDWPGTAESLVNIGLLYYDLKDWKPALDFCFQGLELYREIGAQREIAGAHSSLGSIYSDMKDLEEARTHHTRSLELREELGDKMGQAISLNNIGLIELEMENYEEASEYFQHSIRIREEVGSKQNFASPMNGLARTYLALEKYSEAINWGRRALSNARESNVLKEIEIAAYSLYEAHKNTGAIDDALAMHELYVQTRDSIASEENIKELARFEYQYEYEKKTLADSLQTVAQMESLALNHRVEVAKKESERNLYASGGLVLLLVTVFFFQRKANRNKLLLKEKEADYQREVLYATINSQESERRRIARDLHDEVGAMLSTIKLNLGTVEMQLKQAGLSEQITSPARNLVDETITNVRGISKNLLPPTLEEFGLAHALNDLAEKIEEASGIPFKKDIQPLSHRMPVEHELALFRVIQEMINNALKHAEANEFTVTMREHNGQLELSFADNGKGFNLEAVKKSKSGTTGLGLKNLENRVGAAGGEMEYESRPGKGTSINICVSINNQMTKAA